MPSPGFFELYPSARPALPAGAYMLAADHDLVATPLHNADGELAVDGSDFTVKVVSPRYTMPPDQILSTFPPASAVGDWRERLPQIVFKRRTLPWERNPDTAKPFEDSTPPWLALVVLAEGEGAISPEVDVSECITPGRHLEGDADTGRGRYLDVRQSIVAKIFPTIEDLGLLTHVRKVDLTDTELALGDDDGYLSVVVGNRLPQPGPPAEEGGGLTSVRYTAYVVNLEGQLDLLPTKEESESELEFMISMPELVATELFAQAPDVALDVMVMQGLPAQFAGGLQDAGGVKAAPPGAVAAPGAGTQSATSVNSARGVEPASAGFGLGPVHNTLETADAARGARQWVKGKPLGELAGAYDSFGVIFSEPTYRFPVLVSWDFVCTGDGGFERLMNGLDSGMLGTVDEAADPALRPEVAVTGHISLSHHSRRGEPTESWYRGPFVPQPTARTKPGPDGKLPLAHTGDQLRRVVPDGHEDVGLAAAFEMGRLLTLSKPGIVAAMAAWREELFGVARARSISLDLADDVLAGFADALVQGKTRLEDLVANELLVPYAEKVPDLVGPRAKEFASSRVPDDIAKLTATEAMAGLGLDAGEVAKATEAFGVGGLGTLDVQVAEAPTTPLSAAADELAVLRGMADAHLEHLATQALKLDVNAVKGQSGPPGDHLDHLDRLLAESHDSEPSTGEEG
jgi:hypothetical protein